MTAQNVYFLFSQENKAAQSRRWTSIAFLGTRRSGAATFHALVAEPQPHQAIRSMRRVLVSDVRLRAFSAVCAMSTKRGRVSSGIPDPSYLVRNQMPPASGAEPKDR